MKRLILFRHAKTERHAPSGEDHERRLTPRGWDDAALIAGLAAKRGLRPDVALVSDAVRAQETWDSAKAAFPEAETRRKRELYAADAGAVYALAAAAGVDTVLVIGHNPAMQALACRLLDEAGESALEASVRDGFPTAGLAAFDLEGPTPKVLSVLFPRDHGGGSVHD